MNTHSYNNWKEYLSYNSNIQVTWTEHDLASLLWEATYMTDEIPSDEDWNTFATKNKKTLEAMYKEWKVPKDGSLHYMCIRPKLNEGLKSLLNMYQNVKHNYNFLKLTPGCSLMWHFDTYATFVKFNNIDEEKIKNVCRTVVMMNDWDRGQVLQVGNKIYTHWKSGDTYTWKGDTWHGMCNFGPSDIIVSQITFLDEDEQYTQR
jgi:hypothetical protein